LVGTGGEEPAALIRQITAFELMPRLRQFVRRGDIWRRTEIVPGKKAAAVAVETSTKLQQKRL